MGWYIYVHCACCNHLQGSYEGMKDVPKSFICTKCNVGQKTELKPNVGRTMGNNHNGHELPGGGG